MSNTLPSIKILGSRVHLVQNSDVLARMEHWIHNEPQRCHFIVNTGFHGLWVAHQDQKFKNIVNSSDLFSPDGIATVWISRLKGSHLKERATSADLMKLFFEKANEKGYRSFFYGDTDETLKALKEKLEAKYPTHKIAGTFSPPFRPLSPHEDDEIVKMINDAQPDVLWVGLGLPKQERWIYEHKDRLNVPVAIGVGACFGFFSEKVKRAPLWIGEIGFEWLWRFIQEPKKLWRRDLIDGTRFLIHVFLELAGIRKYE